MATAILHPQDCLRSGLRQQGLILSSPLKARRNPNSYPSSSPSFNHDAPRSGRRRRNSVGVESNRQGNKGRIRSGEPAVTAKLSAKNLVMGQVKILKRGEMLNLERGNLGVGCVDSGDRRLELKGDELDLGLGSTNRLGPDPVLVQKQVMFSELKVVDGIYAGSGAFFASPPPSSVPLPSFLDKNGSATSDLRRLLGLDSD